MEDFINELKKDNYLIDITRPLGEEFCVIRNKQMSIYGLSMVNSLDVKNKTVNGQPILNFAPAIITEELLKNIGFEKKGDIAFQKNNLTITYSDNDWWYLEDEEKKDRGYYKFIHLLQNYLSDFWLKEFQNLR
ncbi:MAG: hypothetical protein LBV43_04050 [Prevotella sp.]|jgi:hypothetical protein|nr:hypothetical protein [Prevotella sp.]